ncbi:tripartite tricarboxylate transporter TctB family protein [Variovorax saccharolyticus]|uniref:tripartite tricarboxylate transporter TctB family protein n=1 Tax=Variovorax saccharolyticus TaxID=3053516 RepID=UPI0025782216|nr:tripartite tricarboxylate transporter TctB family protein [Variovorax sp. J22R187]MDM0018854.1 tripartite tricarboxylate transporter TctB family protein [Variovorax sp. J22R187]
MQIKSKKNFVSGLMFACVGAAFSLGATTYNVGSAARMGPGYFPLIVGALLALLGTVVVLGSLTPKRTGDGEPIGKIAWKPLGFIIGANVLFGILLAGLRSVGLPAMGLIFAIYALVVVACMAGANFSMKLALILATVLAIGSYLTFIVGLKLQFQVWPTFIVG